MTVRTAKLAVVAAGGLGTLAWLGFKVPPQPLTPPPPGSDVGTVDLPGGLPEPVERYHRALGAHGPVPRVDTFALWGRARMKREPLPWLPVTFWSEHRVGWSGRQLITLTWYGLPILRGVDRYAGGRGEFRVGRWRTTGPEIDQGENLFLWAELVLFPSVLATRPGVRWEPLHRDSARLRVPFGADGEDELEFGFDPDTGLISHCRADRYRRPGGPKIGWHIGYERWTYFPAGRYPARITVRWADQPDPWFVLDVDGVATNVPVSPALTADAGTRLG
jgi:hypothetical protein